MGARAIRNQEFLRNIYRRGPFQGHGFFAMPNYFTKPGYPEGDYTISDEPVSRWITPLADHYMKHMEFVEAVGDHSVPTVKLMTGTHIYAAAFGCKVHKFEGSNPAALPLVTTAEEADRLHEPDIWKSPTIYRIFELAEALRRELGPDVPMGPPDMQTGFDTAAIIWNKEDFFCAMMLEPEPVKRLVAKCAGFFKNVLVELRKEFPNMSPAHCPTTWAPPEMGPWLSNDECGAFNEEMFHEFCLPELIDLSKTFGGLGMHCCAAAEHQLDLFRKIPEFYAYNPRIGKTLESIIDSFKPKESPVFSIGWVDEPCIERLIRRFPDKKFIFHASFDEIGQARQWFGRMSSIKK